MTAECEPGLREGRQLESLTLEKPAGVVAGGATTGSCEVLFLVSAVFDSTGPGNQLFRFALRSVGDFAHAYLAYIEEPLWAARARDRAKATGCCRKRSDKAV